MQHLRLTSFWVFIFFSILATHLFSQELIVKLKPTFGKISARNNQDLISSFQKQFSFSKMSAVSSLIKETDSDLFSSIFTLRFETDSAQKEALSLLSRHPQVEYAQINHHFKIDQIPPNDSLYAEQWALAAIHAQNAWGIETGKAEVIISVIDTGVDYMHPDLSGQFWINSGEDLNQNGSVDASDFNGIDDDGNGFIDDIRGWDFTDAPRFIDNGDYAVRDNDPMDEHGHGTMVSGIIAAKKDNAIGLAGLAPGCRIMICRAGTSFGYLEEDDVAAAIVYSVQNGARVINMSFGDVIVTPVLKDVIAFAHRNGVVLVGSAGNSASGEPHYPSGYAEVISIGAATETGEMASFSNFGSTLDLAAPGQDIITTYPGNRYRMFSGTSAATPFVAAIVGLLLSQNGDIHPDVVVAWLKNACTDMLNPGWDQKSGWGLIDAEKALHLVPGVMANLETPKMDAGIAADRVVITGSANGLQMDYFELQYGIGDVPDSWTEIPLQNRGQRVSDTLAVWEIEDLPDGLYNLKLSVFDGAGRVIEDRHRVFVDRTLPELENINIENMVIGDQMGAMVTLKTDDLCRAVLHWRVRGSGSAFQQMASKYDDSTHRFLLNESLTLGQQIEFFVEAVNHAGLVQQFENSGAFYTAAFPIANKQTLSLEIEKTSLGIGHLLSKASDFNRNGIQEIILSPVDANNSIGPVTIFEQQPGGNFTELFQTSHIAVPRDIGDSDGDGLQELLVGFGLTARIYEQRFPDSMPDSLIWESPSEFWAARFADLDQDGKMELVGRSDKEWQVLEYTEGGDFLEIARLVNPTSGSNIGGVPHVEIADFDADGQLELLAGDYDGDVFIYENIGDNSFASTFQDSMPLYDTTDFLSSGDFNGDGLIDFAVACHTDPSANSESEFDNRHWLARIYLCTADNQFEMKWERRFFGYYPVKEFPSGLGTADFDNDGTTELLLGLFPNGYVVRWDEAAQDFSIVSYLQGVRSQRFLVGNEQVLFFNGTEVLQRVDISSSAFAALSTPQLAQVVQTEASLRLNWRPVENAGFYRVNWGMEGGALSNASIVIQPEIEVVNHENLAFTISSGRVDADTVWSTPSPMQHVQKQDTIQLKNIEFIAPNYLVLTFNTAVSEAAESNLYYFVEGSGFPSSVVRNRDGSEVVLFFDTMPPGQYQLDLTVDGQTLEPVEFLVPTQTQTLYIKQAAATTDQVAVDFNVPLAQNSAQKKSNFTFTPNVNVSRIGLSEDQKTVFIDYNLMELHNEKIDMELVVDSLFGVNGEQLTLRLGDRVKVALPAQQVEKLLVFPNPYISAEHKAIHFFFPEGAVKIEIFSVLGQLIFSKELDSTKGNLVWSPKKKPASGVYFVRLKMKSGQVLRSKFLMLN